MFRSSIVRFFMIFFVFANSTLAFGKIETKKCQQNFEKFLKAVASESDIAAEQVFVLLDQAFTELEKSGQKFSEVFLVFQNIDDFISGIEIIAPRHIRYLKKKLAKIDWFIDKDENSALSQEAKTKIKNLVEALTILFNEKDLNLGGWKEKIVDILFYYPTEFIAENKKICGGIAGAIFLAGSILGYRCLKENEEMQNGQKHPPLPPQPPKPKLKQKKAKVSPQMQKPKDKPKDKDIVEVGGHNLRKTKVRKEGSGAFTRDRKRNKSQQQVAKRKKRS